MHILLAHNNYGRFSGEEEVIRTLTTLLESHGHRITPFQRSSIQAGDSLTRKLHALFAGIYSFSSRNQIARIIERDDIDLVEVQNLFPFISPSILPICKKMHVPVVMLCPNYRLFCPNGLHLSHGNLCERCLRGREWNCIVQNCENDIFKSAGYAARTAFARLTRMITDNVTVFIVLSEFQKDRFINSGIPAERIAVLPNIAPDVEILENATIGETVSFVGRVSAEKGVEEFLGAAERLPNLPFAVAGSTDRMPQIIGDKPPNVTISGFLSGKTLDDFFNSSRIMVFPSKWFEGFPTVIAKAMAHGKPVIASRMGAIPEIVDDGVTGLLCQPGDADDLAEKIDYLWKRPDLCREMGGAGLRKAREVYSKETIYTQLMDIYEKAVHLAKS
jgi:glycosyltransferase involved in cell wall biosynthesis